MWTEVGKLVLLHLLLMELHCAKGKTLGLGEEVNLHRITDTAALFFGGGNRCPLRNGSSPRVVFTGASLWHAAAHTWIATFARAVNAIIDDTRVIIRGRKDPLSPTRV